MQDGKIIMGITECEESYVILHWQMVNVFITLLNVFFTTFNVYNVLGVFKIFLQRFLHL